MGEESADEDHDLVADGATSRRCDGDDEDESLDITADVHVASGNDGLPRAPMLKFGCLGVVSLLIA